MPTSQLENQPVAALKVFGKGQGAMLFEDAAEAAAEILGVQPGQTRGGDAMLKISAEQFATVQAGLEERGYEVAFVADKVAHVTLHGHSATVYGEAAQAVAQEFKLPLGETSKQTPKVKLDRDAVESVAAWLQAHDYKVETQELESNLKPKVVFREAPDGETYHVYDGSAKNLAAALEREPDKTPGGRPTLTFDRAEYRQIKQEYGEKLDIATKDLKLEATIATYDGNNRGAVLTGSAAQEVAGVLGLETGYTKPSATTGASMPKLNLTEAQIEPAQAALEAQGYTVAFKELEPSNIANLSRYQDGAILFGKPAEVVAAKLGLQVEQATNQNSMLKVPEASVESAIAILKQEGYDIKETTRQSNQQQAEQPEASGSVRPRLVPREVTLPPERQASVDSLLTYFEAAQVDGANDGATGFSVEYADGKLTATTSEGHTLSVEGDTVKTNFTSADFNELADFSQKTNQALIAEGAADYDFELDD